MGLENAGQSNENLEQFEGLIDESNLADFEDGLKDLELATLDEGNEVTPEEVVKISNNIGSVLQSYAEQELFNESGVSMTKFMEEVIAEVSDYEKQYGLRRGLSSAPNRVKQLIDSGGEETRQSKFVQIRALIELQLTLQGAIEDAASNASPKNHNALWRAINAIRDLSQNQDGLNSGFINSMRSAIKDGGGDDKLVNSLLRRTRHQDVKEEVLAENQIAQSPYYQNPTGELADIITEVEEGKQEVIDRRANMSPEEFIEDIAQELQLHYETDNLESSEAYLNSARQLLPQAYIALQEANAALSEDQQEAPEKLLKKLSKHATVVMELERTARSYASSREEELENQGPQYSDYASENSDEIFNEVFRGTVASYFSFVKRNPGMTIDELSKRFRY